MKQMNQIYYAELLLSSMANILKSYDLKLVLFSPAWPRSRGLNTN